MPVTETRRYIPVLEIGEPGKYQISQDPNEEYYRGGMRKSWPDGYYVPGDPFILPTRLIDYLNATFPDLQRMSFKPSMFMEGAISPVKLDYAPAKIDCNKWEGDGGDLKLDGHITRFSGGGKLRDKHQERDDFNFRLEDKGSLKIVRNELQFTQSQRRNGVFYVTNFGRRATEQVTGSMVGFVEISGDKYGELMACALDFTRNFLREQNYSIWRRPQGS